MLALQLNVQEHFFLDLFHDFVLAGAFAGLLLGIVVDVGERSGVDIESLDIDEDFVVVKNIHVIVQFVGGLGKNALGLDDTMSAVLVTFRLHMKYRFMLLIINTFFSNRLPI